MADDDFNPYEPALQHIVLTLVGELARSQPDPERWLGDFGAEVARMLDGWFPPGVPDAQADAYRQVTLGAAKALVGCISLRRPPIPGAAAS